VIIDTSALVAILFAEPEADEFINLINDSEVKLSAASYFEAGAVIDRAGDPVASRALDELLTLGEVRIEPVTEDQARIARQAYRDFGKGSGHPARLNFGDCFSYALAKAADQALLYKGDDFNHTDLVAAAAP
jgi:ribonuclease VapC